MGSLNFCNCATLLKLPMMPEKMPFLGEQEETIKKMSFGCSGSTIHMHCAYVCACPKQIEFYYLAKRMRHGNGIELSTSFGSLTFHSLRFGGFQPIQFDCTGCARTFRITNERAAGESHRRADFSYFLTHTRTWTWKRNTTTTNKREQP